ncbi:MAG: NRDE family protein [Steroidobacteraceae bacterium]|jgi:uncharacterized protein with NRDE domain
MCLILLAWRVHPEFPCVLAANRDESHDRPTSAADWWHDPAGILAGRDLKEGGTWLGMTREGRFAALTNYRDPAINRLGVRSRGRLVSELLQSGYSVADALDYLRGGSAAYNAFNMIFCDGERLGVFESVRGEGRELGPGIYGLSNNLLDTPWPKVKNAKSRLAAALTDVQDVGALLQLLRDDRRAADEELPQTGIGLEWERLLSSAFVRADGYGTRCSTVIRINRAGRVFFDEWSWDSAGGEIDRKIHQFDLPAGRPQPVMA